MTKTLTITIALAGGIMGGLLARFVTPPAAFAQGQPSARQALPEIRAQRLTLVDGTNGTVATFEYDPGSSERNRLLPPRIVLRDSEGRILWSAGGSGIQPLTTR